MAGGGRDRTGAARRAPDVIGKARQAWGESPFYQMRLNGPAPDRLLHTPTDPWACDAQVGAALRGGCAPHPAGAIESPGDPAAIWDVLSPSEPGYAWLQGFSWLRDLAALPLEEMEDARSAARGYVAGWLDRYGRWSAEAWAPEITAERLLAWCRHARLILKEADALWRSRVLTSMGRQMRHLSQVAHRAGPGEGRIFAAAGLVVAGCCLPAGEPCAARGLDVLHRELRLQLRTDGGHASRNPETHLALLLQLQGVVAALRARRMETPGFLKHAIDRMTAVARLYRCGDGGLAVFNGGGEGDAGALAAALPEETELEGRPVGFAPHTGYQRLHTPRMTVIADTGRHAPPPWSATAHDGAGAFELSSGRCRIVVNCGGGGRFGDDWAAALRRADAHSTLIADFPGRRPAGEASARRAEDERGHLLEIERVLAPGVVHRRRLFLSTDGGDLRGEDALVCEASEAVQWRIRFHLHPGVRASSARSGRTAILMLAGGEGWRFKGDGRQVALEKSVYAARGEIRKTEQLVLSGETDGAGETLVKWAFRRLEPIVRP